MLRASWYAATYCTYFSPGAHSHIIHRAILLRRTHAHTCTWTYNIHMHIAPSKHLWAFALQAPKFGSGTVVRRRCLTGLTISMQVPILDSRLTGRGYRINLHYCFSHTSFLERDIVGDQISSHWLKWSCHNWWMRGTPSMYLAQSLIIENLYS